MLHPVMLLTVGGSRFRTVFRHRHSKTHGCLHVLGVRKIFPGNIERGPVIDGRANDRNADRHIDSVVEVKKLHRDMTLVVIHGDNKVILAV